MGTHASTRIANEHDYIEHHTRWDGFSPEIVENIQSLPTAWQTAIENIKEKLNSDEQGTFSLKDWATSFERLLNDYTANPTIESTSLLLCFLSFTHHHVLPNKASGDLLDYWGEGSPDVTAQLIGKDMVYTYQEDYDADAVVQPIIETKAKQIDPEFKVMRIYSVDNDGNMLDTDYVDFKYRNLTEEELFEAVLKLPLFMRDLYTVTKMSRSEKEAIDHDIDSLVRLTKKLAQFYKPTSEYMLFGRDKKDNVRNLDERKQSIEDTKDDAISMIPFDLDITTLGTHLALSQPGDIFPLTKGERLGDYEISFKVGLHNSRLSHIYCNIPNKDEKDVVELVQNIANHYGERISHFDHYHKIDSIADIQFIKLVQDEPFYGISYEETLIKLMENQYLIEMNNLYS